MSISTLLWLVTFALVFLLIVIGLIAFVDWRAIIVRRFGPDYKKGLAHIKVGGVWTYRESTLLWEGDDAMTYYRETLKDGKVVIVDDIVPNAIGYSYDEYTGRRQYRVQAGGTIATSDDGGVPVVDYPSELISVHVMDRTVSNYAASVNAEGGFNWKLLLIGAAVSFALIAFLLFTGIIKLPAGNSPATTPAPATAPAPSTTPPVSGPVGGQ